MPFLVPGNTHSVTDKTSQRTLINRIHLERIRKGILLLFSLFLFILALTFLREGAKQMGPFVRDSLSVNNPANALGFGWLFAYVVMSGSPVAAIALTLLDVGSLTELEAFAMITGSRLGASFIVLFIGFIYMLRGRGERGKSLSTGLLSLFVTQTTYIPALVVGVLLLSNGWMDSVQLTTAAQVTSIFDRVFDPIVNTLLLYLPRWVIFGLGFVIMLVSFTLLDKSLPEIKLQDSAFRGMARILYRPVVTFALGALVTSITMSVSLSISILIPLSMRGYVRRENIIPYVMGANITTFIDTLIAAVLLANPTAFTVVLVEMSSVAIVSLAIILFVYRPYERFVLGFTNRLLTRRKLLMVYMFSIVGLPFLLMFI
jgi:solute carrier family 34 (sodium-dependent phosphate cotransporter)